MGCSAPSLQEKLGLMVPGGAEFLWLQDKMSMWTRWSCSAKPATLDIHDRQTQISSENVGLPGLGCGLHHIHL